MGDLRPRLARQTIAETPHLNGASLLAELRGEGIDTLLLDDLAGGLVHEVGTLQGVASGVNQKTALCSGGLATLCRVEWNDLQTPWERMRWARMRAGYQRPTDAARSVNIKPVTYRTYEIAPGAEGGREPPLSEVQRIARKFDVNWVWLASGEGSPETQRADQRLAEISSTIAQLPKSRREDALNAALSVVNALAKRGG